jgi:hypothetical protein
LLDLYWLILPAQGGNARFGLVELSFAIFFISIALLWIRRSIDKNEDMPVGDPFLKEGLEFHL